MADMYASPSLLPPVTGCSQLEQNADGGGFALSNHSSLSSHSFEAKRKEQICPMKQA